MLFGLIKEWILSGLASIFIGLFDWVAYNLVAASYSVFLYVSRMNIFATDGGYEIFRGFTTRIYAILSVVMVFVFAYFLIMMIVDPDGGDKIKMTSSLIKDTMISVIAIVFLPLIFNYMSVFQEHILTNNTIAAMVLGTNATVSGEKAGSAVSLMVFSSFYHPVGSDYSTFFGPNGEVKDSAVQDCVNNGANQDACQLYKDAADDWFAKTTNGGTFSVSNIGSFTKIGKLRDQLQEDNGMEYMWIVSTGAAIMVAYFFISYAIDVGTRAVKLAFLQIIAPVPIIMRLIPSFKSNFKLWSQELLKTYLDIFFRLAVIFFIILLIQMVPTLIEAVFS